MRLILPIAAIVLAAAAPRASAPSVYAITGARIVTAAGAPIEKGTVVIRGGVIEAVGPAVRPPEDAQVIEGNELIVYPGLIDLANEAAVSEPASAAPQNPDTREVTERWKRERLLRAHVSAADYLKADASELQALAAAGVTTVLAVPSGEGIAGHSALVNVVAPPDDPQVSRLALDRGGRTVLRGPVALHVGFPARPTGAAYPVSLMGTIAFMRQAFYDARHYHAAQGRGSADPSARVPYDAALAAMAPALGRKVPVALQASTPREILRALAFANEFDLDPVIVGAHGAGDVAKELKAAKAKVILSLNYPERPKSLAPDDDEAYDALRARAEARRAAAALDAAGVPFAFGSAGLKDPKAFVKNAGIAVAQGLPVAAAVRALTAGAARIAGADDALGTIEKGKVANLVVTDGDLFEEKTKVVHVFVDGWRVPPPAQESRGNRTN